MARLQAVSGSRSCALQAEHLVGRGSQCALRLPSQYVSAQHALLRWQGQRWEIIDRGSRNGTCIDETTLVPGQPYELKEGSLVSFGHQSESWTLVDAGAPGVMVIALDTGEAISDSIGVLAVPSAADAEATIYLDVDGTWRLESAHVAEPVGDGHIFACAGRTFRFCCPTTVGSTAAAAMLDPTRSTLRFSVSRDEEFIELSLDHSRGRVNLGARSQNYLLLQLAQAYQSDIENGFPVELCGWLDKEHLAERLKVTAQQVDGEVYRIRRHFAEHQLPQAATIIERRVRTRQLRIGIPLFHIERS